MKGLLFKCYSLLVVLLLAACNDKPVACYDIDELLYSHAALQAENAMLQNLIDTLQQEVHDTTIESSTLLNPIDRFFAEIEHEVYFHDTTWSMVVYGFVVGTAWKAEMDNFHEILLSMTQNDFKKKR